MEILDTSLSTTALRPRPLSYDSIATVKSKHLATHGDGEGLLYIREDKRESWTFFPGFFLL